MRDQLPPAIEETRRYQTLQVLVNCTRRNLLPDPDATEAQREEWSAELQGAVGRDSVEPKFPRIAGADPEAVSVGRLGRSIVRDFSLVISGFANTLALQWTTQRRPSMNLRLPHYSGIWSLVIVPRLCRNSAKPDGEAFHIVKVTAAKNILPQSFS